MKKIVMLILFIVIATACQSGSSGPTDRPTPPSKRSYERINFVRCADVRAYSACLKAGGSVDECWASSCWPPDAGASR